MTSTAERRSGAPTRLMLLAFLIAAMPDAIHGAESRDLVLSNVTVVSPERAAPLEHAWVAIRDGRIAAVGGATTDPDDSFREARVVDGKGRYVTPGLIDSHVHLASIPGVPYPTPPELSDIVAAYEAQLPRSYLYFGYTTVIDLNVIDRTFIERFEARPLHPDVFHCGGALALANGYPMAFMPPESRFSPYRNFLYDPRQEDDIPDDYAPGDHSPAAVVGRVAESGGICVKTFRETGFGPLRNLPTPTHEMIAAVKRESHDRGLVVTMHANSLDAHRFATEAGVDVIVHGLWNAPGDGELTADTKAVLDATVAKRIGYMPTMQVLEGLRLMFEPGFLDDPTLRLVLPGELIDWYRTDDGQWFAEELRADFDGLDDARIHEIMGGPGGAGGTSRRTVGYLAKRDARFLSGTDTPSAPTYGNPPGYNGYMEMKNLVAAGVSLPRLLAAATIDNAEAFGIDDRYGTVEEGRIANLLLLDENPLESVEAWDSIRGIVLHGAWVPRASLAATDIGRGR